jgi:hypothetical protein
MLMHIYNLVVIAVVLLFMAVAPTLGAQGREPFSSDDLEVMSPEGQVYQRIAEETCRMNCPDFHLIKSEMWRAAVKKSFDKERWPTAMEHRVGEQKRGVTFSTERVSDDMLKITIANNEKSRSYFLRKSDGDFLCEPEPVCPIKKGNYKNKEAKR